MSFRPRGRVRLVVPVVAFGVIAAAMLAPGSAVQAAPRGSIQIAKRADAAAVNATDPIGYTIAVGNVSNHPTNVRLTDVLPTNPGTRWSISPLNLNCSISSGTLGCSLKLNGNSIFTVHVVSPTTTATCGTVRNTASVTTNNLGSATSPVAVIAVKCPTLHVAKSPYASSVNAGDSAIYDIVGSNSGPGTAYGFTLADTLPSGLTWTLGVSDPSCAIATSSSGVQTLTCGPKALASGGSVSADVTATTSASNCPSISNTASATATNGASASSGPVSIAVNCLPDLIVPSIAFNSSPYKSSYSYTVTVKNQGIGTANLAGVAVQGYFSPTEGTWPDSHQACGTSFSSGRLAPGASTTIVVGCGGFSPGPGDNWLNVKVNYNNAIAELDTTNNVGSVALPVTLAVTKTADASSVNAGDFVGYAIVGTNNGPSDAYGFTLTDTLPSGLTWTLGADESDPTCSISSSGGVQTLTCGPEMLTSGGTVSAHVYATTSAANCPSISNSASVSATNGGTASSGSATIDINCLPDLIIQSIAFTGPSDSYTVTVKNQGTGTANLGGVPIQGYYGTDSTTWPGAHGACGKVFPVGTTLAPGDTADLVVGCTADAQPGDSWLVVKVNFDSTIAESDTTNNIGSASLFDASLIDDGACHFTVTAAWHNTQVDNVDGNWYLDGTLVGITLAPGPGGTVTGQTATMQADHTPSGPVEHTWQVLVHFYNGLVPVGQMWTTIDAARCGLP